MAEKIVLLSRIYEAHGRSFGEVTLREPKLRDHLALGDPIEVYPAPDGEGRFPVEHLDRIEAYLKRLAVPAKPGFESIQDLDLVDSIAVKETITGFFMNAHKLRRAATNSSGAADNGSETLGT